MEHWVNKVDTSFSSYKLYLDEKLDQLEEKFDELKRESTQHRERLDVISTKFTILFVIIVLKILEEREVLIKSLVTLFK